jgi:hypothetical protein
MVTISLEGVTFGLQAGPVARCHRDTDFKINVSRWEPSVFTVVPSDSDRIPISVPSNYRLQDWCISLATISLYGSTPDSDRILSFVTVETYQFYGSWFQVREQSWNFITVNRFHLSVCFICYTDILPGPKKCTERKGLELWFSYRSLGLATGGHGFGA